MINSSRILLVSNDADSRKLMQFYFMNEDLECICFETGKSLLRYLNERNCDCILFDVKIHDFDEFELCAAVREISDVPIFFLSPSNDVADIVKALNSGADGYLTKPYELRELVARIKALIRRTIVKESNDNVNVGDIRIDIKNFQMFINNQEVDMPPRELELLYFFATNPNKSFSRMELLESVWGYDFYGNSRTVDVHVRRIRDKLQKSKKCRVKTVWGHGYMFEAR